MANKTVLLRLFGVRKKNQKFWKFLESWKSLETSEF